MEFMLSKAQANTMFKDSSTFSSFSVNDLQKAKDFYANTLGIAVTDSDMPGIINLELSSNKVTIYTKPDHTPASFTVLNFITGNVEKAVDELTEKGVQFQHYDTEHIKTDSKGILHDKTGPTIAWFRDPAGNILSVLSSK